MAAVSDCFTVGSTVACTTCFHKNIEGEVLAFDPETKMLILSILYKTKLLNQNQINEQKNEKMFGDILRVFGLCQTIFFVSPVLRLCINTKVSGDLA